MKHLEIINLYNGLDITQGKHFIKVSYSTYISKTLQGHHWDTPNKSSQTRTPLTSDRNFIKDLETSKGPTDSQLAQKLLLNMNFKYLQTIGEILFAAITCRPDILFAVIKLSQYSTHLAKIHYNGVKHVFKYLHDTKEDCLQFWRDNPRSDLPDLPYPLIPK